MCGDSVFCKFYFIGLPFLGLAVYHLPVSQRLLPYLHGTEADHSYLLLICSQLDYKTAADTSLSARVLPFNSALQRPISSSRWRR